MTFLAVLDTIAISVGLDIFVYQWIPDTIYSISYLRDIINDRFACLIRPKSWSWIKITSPI